MCRASSETWRAALGGVVDGGVDHSLVNAVPQNFGRAIDHRLNEEDGVELVDVVLVQDSLVKSAETFGDTRRELGTATVQHPGEHPSQKGDRDRDRPSRAYSSCLAGRFSGFLRQRHRPPETPEQGNVRSGHRNPNEAANDRKDCQDDQRPQHHPWTLMRFTVAMAMIVSLCPCGIGRAHLRPRHGTRRRMSCTSAGTYRRM